MQKAAVSWVWINRLTHLTYSDRPLSLESPDNVASWWVAPLHRIPNILMHMGLDITFPTTHYHKLIRKMCIHNIVHKTYICCNLILGYMLLSENFGNSDSQKIHFTKRALKFITIRGILFVKWLITTASLSVISKKKLSTHNIKYKNYR